MADPGEIYATAGRDFAGHIWSAMERIQAQRQQQDRSQQQVQGILDAAKSIQVNDPKTGKPKPFFSADQVQMVQHLLDQHKAYQAGAVAAGLGMGKDILQRAAKANAMSQGPVIAHAPDGTPMKLNPSTGTWETYAPRNPQGVTATSQQTQTRLAQAARARTAASQQKEFDSTLKGLGINRQQLFDPHALEGGTVSGGQFYVPGQEDPHTKTVPIPADKDGGFDQSKITAFRVGYRAPVYPQDKSGKPNTTLPPVDKGKPGTYLSPEDLQAYRDTALSLADPKFKQATLAPQWAQGKDPEAPTNPNDPNSATVGQVLQQAQDYAASMRKQALTNPEYRRQILGASTASATDQTTQMPGNVDVNPVQQVTAPPPPNDEPPSDVEE